VQPNQLSVTGLVEIIGRSTYRCTDKCEGSNGVNPGEGCGFNVRLDVLIIYQHCLEDYLMPEKTMTGLLVGN
jgi:hypothetical protein